ncbi:MAG TPA: hypothetical protein PKK64_13105 [Saprospiraceae bacterium]|nr:hypothetical protein [Saprospiraceae bacterium]HNF10419.1 hypothetical protein [Saprospiraceae bacterium]HNJ53859.1 hypothetical protein [Saprospiraceae bacterium]HNM54401.1 hypothetical protein [Saprospiraceae bacterium]HNN69421.1 hypothetical protein [Saprospiraceae bacterium]
MVTLFFNCGALSYVLSQKWSHSFGISAIGSWYSGSSAQRYSSINSGTFKAYTNSPYGSLPGAGISLNYFLQRHLGDRWLLEMGPALQLASTHVNIIKVSESNGNTQFSAKGNTYLVSTMTGLAVALTRQWSLNQWKLAVSPSFNLWYIINSKERGHATTTQGIEYRTNEDRSTIKVDLMPGIELRASKNKFGFTAGYFHGLNNYLSGYVGGINTGYLNSLKFGLQFWL